MTRLRHGAMLIALGAAAACIGPPSSSASRTPARADQVILAASYALTHEGARRGVILADSVFVEQSTLEADLRQIRLTAFTADGHPASTITAPSGKLKIGGDSVRLSGGVRAIAPTGDTLVTPSLLFDQGSLRLVTDTTYRLGARTGSRSGKGLTTDFRLRAIDAGGGR